MSNLNKEKIEVIEHKISNKEKIIRNLDLFSNNIIM